MSLTLKKPETPEYELVPAGTHPAICTDIIDIGPQRSEYNGEVKEQNKIRLVFEIPGQRVKFNDADGNEVEKPMKIGKTYTASMFTMATLRKHLESWRGKTFTQVEEMGFDITTVLGKPCTLGVQHKEYQGREYAAITSITPPIAGVEVEAESPLVSFDFDRHSQAELESLPDWLQERVTDGKKLLEEQRSRVASGYEGGGFRESENPAEGLTSDDVPF